MTSDLPELAYARLIAPYHANGVVALPVGAKGTVLSLSPKTHTYTIEFFEPRRTVETVPMDIVAELNIGAVPTYWRQKGLSVRASNAFANGGIRNLDDLKKQTCQDLLKLPNFGRGSLKEVQKVTGLPAVPDLIAGPGAFEDGVKAGLAEAAKLLDVSGETIRRQRHLGKMTAREMRCVLAALRWKKAEVEGLINAD